MEQYLQMGMETHGGVHSMLDCILELEFLTSHEYMRGVTGAVTQVGHKMVWS